MSDASAPIFVVGSPRSGTHLMRFCLSKHSRIYIAPETGFFWKVYGNRRLVPHQRLPDLAERIMTYVFESGDPSMAEFGALRDQLVHRISEGVDDYTQLAQLILSSFAATRGKVRWGEKTPFHLFYVAEIRRVFPTARIICMVREPKTAIASYLKSSHMPESLPRAVATQILARRAVRHEGESMLVVPYEDVVGEPLKTLQGCADYLGESFEPAMLVPGMRDSSYQTQVMSLDPSITIDSASADRERWQTVLDSGTAAMIDEVFRADREDDVSKLPQPLRVQVQYMLARYKWAIIRRRHGFGDILHPRRWLR